MKVPHSEQRTFKREDDGMGGRAQESTSSFGGLKYSEAPKKDEQSKASVERDEPYVYVQETYHVEWKFTPEEAEDFIKECQRNRGKHLDDFKRGSRRPDHVGQSVQIQDTLSYFSRKDSNEQGE